MGKAPPVVRVWAPLHSARGRVVGATEVALDDDVVNAMIDEATRTIWLAVALVFGVLWLVLALLVRGASERLRGNTDDLAARSHDLVESSRELEATLLETIETLNAAVEARDPYTAGHSQRVRRVSLAIGRELRLPTRQLGALATGALFHDIGKIGMPDSILTKPEKLDRAEAAIMREHVTRGAEIVSRISSLKDSVPAIRHHHERWDGLGYPDRLAGTDVPDRGGDHRDRRRVGCHDDRPTVCDGARHGRGDGADPRGSRQAVQSRSRRCIPHRRAQAPGRDHAARGTAGHRCSRELTRYAGKARSV